MSETSVLPSAVAPPAADAPVVPVDGFGDEQTAGGDRRRLIILGAVLGVLVVAAAAYLLLRGGGSKAAPPTLVPRGTPRAAAPPSSPAHPAGGTGSGAKTAAGTTIPKTSTKQLARDPFKPLIVVAAPATTGTGSAPTTSVGPGGAGSSASGGSGATAPAVKGHPLWIQLVSTHGTSSALFAVGYAHNKVYRFDVTAPSANSTNGTVFDREFSLLGIQNGEVTVQVGDDTPFDLRRGSVHGV
jgi:hypothetical protein